MAVPDTATLRADIDSGRTADKVAFPDPAASPLGTDDEAAGMPNGRRRVALAQAQEGALDGGRDGASPNPETTRAMQPSPGRSSAETHEAARPMSGLDPKARVVNRGILIGAAVVLVIAAVVVVGLWG